ncbi:Rhodanese-like protein [Basidiobolus meristosporus CBS 931.73]|uniref:M-phase inducer phosphatase n=1 Tax=Basidiobolus meristosporus CBS 931.73 TaxID=1314790 RepID=A0A1Y1YCP8_9FUNG|nr:Rhodanese-like protein [Basidiobolus meristosporus CBS 931.73]|eukprot:ORX95769.1 Rhodanese-like protein [Basidiobolus meristosporus CBS 931.73]
MSTKVCRSAEVSDMPLPSPPHKLRKTQSMCLSREEFLFSDVCKRATLDAHGQQHSIPCFDSKEDTLKRICPETLQRVLSGEFEQAYEQLVVVDCRFPYEYAGGHIKGAINLSSKDELEKHFLNNFEFSKRTVIIFHCEYSSQRGPRMALHLRSRDRELNATEYPNLFFPELYILDGGYRNFYFQAKQLCIPQNYVEMNDEQHMLECKSRMMHFKESFSSRRSKSRSPSWSQSKSSECHSLLDRQPVRRASLLTRLRPSLSSSGQPLNLAPMIPLIPRRHLPRMMTNEPENVVAAPVLSQTPNSIYISP